MSAPSPREALQLRLRKMPSGVYSDAQPDGGFFTRKLKEMPIPDATVDALTVRQDYVRLRGLFEDALIRFAHHVSMHGCEQAAHCNLGNIEIARRFNADVSRWLTAIADICDPAHSAVSPWPQKVKP